MKFLVAMKSKEIFLIDQDKKSKYSKPFKKFSHFKELALYNNIQQVKNYLIENPFELTDIVRMVDQTIDKSTKWTYVPHRIEKEN